MTCQQYEVLNGKLTETGGELNIELGGPTRIPQNFKTLIFLWYMANQNSFRELGDIFQVAQSTAHDVVIQVLTAICHTAPAYMKWPSLSQTNLCRCFSLDGQGLTMYPVQSMVVTSGYSGQRGMAQITSTESVTIRCRCKAFVATSSSSL